jgi:hypothetical protein
VIRKPRRSGNCIINGAIRKKLRDCAPIHGVHTVFSTRFSTVDVEAGCVGQGKLT